MKKDIVTTSEFAIDLFVLSMIVSAVLIINVSASSNDFCFGTDCHSEPDHYINASMFNNSSHQYLQCIDCHVNVTEYPNSTHGNFKKNLTLPLPSSSYNSTDFLLCYGCHKESNLLGLESGYSNSLWTHSGKPGYPLMINSISTNFVNEIFFGFNFGNYPANIHWDHLDLHKIDAGKGPDLIWDSNRDRVLDSMVSCPACHDPHGNTTRPGLTRQDIGIQHGVDANGSYGEVTSIEYQWPGGDVYCAGCHGAGVKYYRPEREVLNFSDLHISPVDMTGCIQSGCHFSNVLTVEHIDKRDLDCATCHQSSQQRVIESIEQGNKSCFSCHSPHSGGSHSTHIDAAKGPFISCFDCHGDRSLPLFADGQNLQNTNVCNTCHSPGGSYDGVNDLIIGAKSNWAGVYNSSDDTLKAGKEKWCAGCHDSAPSLIKGIQAPNISGDDSNYGYYATGHGANDIIECGSCHNFSGIHIDAIKRSYRPDSDYLTYDNESRVYQTGFRLKDISTGYAGKYALHIPRTGHVYPPGFREDKEFALCFECHNRTQLFNGGDPTTGAGAQTNFRMLIDGGGGNPAPTIGNYYSLHDVHTWGANGPWGPETPQYDSDFNGTADSRMSCPACHNIHGSRSPSMVRTGELIGKVPALNLKYVDNAPGQALHFISQDLLNRSTGAGMDVSFGPGQLSSNGVCNMCHAQQTGGPEPHTAYYREPDISIPDFRDFHTSPVDMSGCINTGCHNSNILTTEHIKRNLSCATCHKSNEPRVIDAVQQGNKSCFSCHSPHSGGSHSTHVGAAKGPHISCQDCHGTQSPPLFADGQDIQNTNVCDTCHSPGGSYDGVNDINIGAKPNWAGVYNSSDDTLKAGKEKWCAGCHDNGPAVVKGETAANKTGDNTTYGYYVTGHGRSTPYARMSWQDIAATGNPGADQGCDKCHNTTLNHITEGVNPDSHRLKNGYGNDQSNSNCNNCHPPGASAAANPQFYTNSQDYEASAHGGKNCTECHDIHGSAGPYVGMTKGNKESLCIQCHSGKAGHALNIQFGKDGKTYSLQCTSCHNIHIITGNVSNPGKSPITLFSNLTKIWGDESAEKMNFYAGSGTYRTPKGDSLSGSQLPDYITFCIECHGVPQNEFGSHGGISWGGDEPHGLNSANNPSEGSICPDWFSCGLAEGWDGDVCTNGSICWPVIPRGRGDTLFSRPEYNHEERIAGANFVLSCSDCHVTHESGTGSKLRSTVNGGPGSTIWNDMCNNCHYYYGYNHKDKSCASASCHGANNLRFPGGSNTIHGMGSRTGDQGTRNFKSDLVADMRFENNLADSGYFRMHGRWFDTAGSYAAGKSGNAVVLDGNKPIELGTRDSNWSTEAGKHGTWVYSEMKKNMTLEAWVFPNGSQVAGENHIISKHTYSDGGYALLLKTIGGTLRAALLTNVNGGESVWNSPDCNGLRGAYSTVPVPLNEWTHVAAVFDPSLPDRDLNDGSVGRIRIYVNGEDVTASYPNNYQCYAQPAAGETDMFPYSEMKVKNESRCYGGQWCASALSIGGLMWGDGYRKGLIGKIDEVKVWNVAKTSAYFESLDASIPPKIIKVEGAIGRDWIIVTFSEGVYANTGKSGNLVPNDFILTDTDNSRTILSVDHTAGNSTAKLTLNSSLDSSNDIDVDTLAAASNSIYDDHDIAAGTVAVAITGQKCPSGPAIFQLNESAGSITASDEENVIKGKVNDAVQSFPGDGYFHGDGSNNYIDFENNTQCMQGSTAMTLETRIKPSVVDSGGESTIKRIFARDGSGNYQISLWRNTNITDYPNYRPASGVTSIAFWVNPVDNHGGNAWKPVLTNYTYYPIVANHWYKVKVVWNSSKKGGIPSDIFVDDQGTDGNGAGENWTGYRNAADSNQSQLTSEKRLYEGDRIITSDGQFVIGANVNNHANNVFNGSIDYIKWKDSADYSGVDWS